MGNLYQDFINTMVALVAVIMCMIGIVKWRHYLQTKKKQTEAEILATERRKAVEEYKGNTDREIMVDKFAQIQKQLQDNTDTLSSFGNMRMVFKEIDLWKNEIMHRVNGHDLIIQGHEKIIKELKSTINEIKEMTSETNIFILRHIEEEKRHEVDR